MTRAAKDNKFEIVTSHRIFVFRAENEGKTNTNLTKQSCDTQISLFISHTLCHLLLKSIPRSLQTRWFPVSQLCGGSGCPHCSDTLEISWCLVGTVLDLELTVRNTGSWSWKEPSLESMLPSTPIRSGSTRANRWDNGRCFPSVRWLSVSSSEWFCRLLLQVCWFSNFFSRCLLEQDEANFDDPKMAWMK